MRTPDHWPDHIPLRYTVESYDPESWLSGMKWKEVSKRSELVASQLEARADDRPRRGTHYPREYVIRLGPIVLDRFLRSDDGAWTHHDLVSGVQHPVEPSTLELD